MSKFKVGDRVRVKPGTVAGSHPTSGCYCHSNMLTTEPMTVVGSALCNGAYPLSNGWNYMPEWIELLSTGITATVQHETVKKPVSVTVVIPYDDAAALRDYNADVYSRVVASLREALG